MPKEQVRKRGRRKPKIHQETFPGLPISPLQAEAAAPTGIHPARAALISGREPRSPPHPSADEAVQHEQALEWERGPRIDSEYPFGVLDPNLKGYFRNIEDTIRDWEGAPSSGEEREGKHFYAHTGAKRRARGEN